MMETPRQNWQLFDEAMSDDLVENIIKLGGETQRASTFNNADNSVRSSRVSWLTHHEWVKDVFYHPSMAPVGYGIAMRYRLYVSYNKIPIRSRSRRK